MKITGKHRASQDIHISGWECGSEFELKMVVEFTAHSGSPATLVDPEEFPSVEVDSVRFFEHLRGQTVKEVIMPDWMVERFTQNAVFEKWLLGEAGEAIQTAIEDKAEADREDAYLRHGLREEDIP
jgi:hypothetical protein